MNVGISINRFMNDYLTDEQMLAEYARIGFNCIDCGLQYDVGNHVRSFIPEIFAEEDAFVKHFSDLRAQVERHGMTVSQTHTAFPIDDKGLTISDEMMLGLKRSIRATHLLGAKYMVFHPAKRPYNELANELFEFNVSVLKALLPTLEQYDVYLAVENLFGRDDLSRPVPCNVSYPSQILRLIDAVGSDRVVVCLDTGHMLLCGGDCAAAVCEYGDKLRVLHVHDNDKIDDRHRIPMDGIGEIEIDWQEFIKALKEVGFDGTFSLELDGAFFYAAAVYPELVFDYMKIAHKVARKLTEGLL